MKVAIASSGNNLDAPIDPRFGRCSYFVVVDTDTMEFQAISNAAAAQGSGAGIAAAQLVAGSGATAIVAANIGPNAYTALSAGGMKIYSAAGGTVKMAVEALKSGQLVETQGANVGSHHGMGRR